MNDDAPMPGFDVCVYHANCADGFGAAYACWHFHDKYDLQQPQYIAAKYGDEPPTAGGNSGLWRNGPTINKRILVVDFSYSPEDMEAMCAATKEVVWIDHHKTAIEAGAEYFQHGASEPYNFHHLLSSHSSGCALTWSYFTTEPMPLLLKQIEDRDLWRFEMEGSKELHAGIQLYDYDFEIWDVWASDHFQLYELKRKGEAVLRRMQRDIEAMLPNAQRCILDRRIGVVLNVPPMWASEAGQMMLGQYDCQFAATWYEDQDGAQIWSLRSDENKADVSEIAKVHGGGGHRNAAGFKLTREALRDVVHA